VKRTDTTADNITNEVLRALIQYARDIDDWRLTSQAMRALDGDSLYNHHLREICAAAYAGARMSREFKAAARKVRAAAKAASK
jgi:hypothetical protein